MRKFLNDPSTYLAQSLSGMALAHPELNVDIEARVVNRASGPVPGKVGIVSGGGSGHDPLHAGFVGPGMLDAAACGEIFTSPVPEQILTAIERADGGAGVLLLVKNYTGDVMNFEMAQELAAAAHPELLVGQVVIDDDLAVENSTFTAGRRGTGLAVIVEKLIGAAAEAGMGLDDLTALAGNLVRHGGSMGVALSSCTVPSVGHPTFDLPEGEVEMGVGIHGEPGRRRQAWAPAAQLAKELTTPILRDLPVTAGSHVIAMLNGLGATPQSELYLMFDEVSRILAARDITVERAIVGNYVTALDMAGCSLTLMKLHSQRWLQWWDAPVRTPGMTW